MSEPRYEYCSECGDATGRSGAGDDSIYVALARDWHKPSGAIWPVGEEVGPLCETCYDRLKEDGLTELET